MDRLLLAELGGADGDRMGDDRKVFDDIGAAAEADGYAEADYLRDVLSAMAYDYAWELINQRGRDDANSYVMRNLAAGTGLTIGWAP